MELATRVPEPLEVRIILRPRLDRVRVEVAVMAPPKKAVPET